MGEKYGKILKFDKPADDFRSAFPLGNGKIGAMVFGGLHKERVILSDATLWSGSDSYEYPDDVYKVLPKIEKLVLEGRYKEAQDLYISDFLAFRPMPMDGANCGSLPYGCLQTMGDLELFFFQYGSRLNQEWYPYELERWLDLEEGTANYRHRSYWETNTPGYDKGMYYDRKALVSRKYNCFAMRISATSAGSIGFNARLSRTENYEVTAVSDDTIIMEGQLEDGHGRGGVRYACCVRIVPEGENAYTEANGTVLRVRRADAAVIYVTTATDMKSFGAPCIDDVRAAVLSDMDLAVNAGWSEIFADHAASHSGYFNRMALQINDIDEELEAMTLDRRL